MYLPYEKSTLESSGHQLTRVGNFVKSMALINCGTVDLPIMHRSIDDVKNFRI